MEQYKQTLLSVVTRGVVRGDRTGIGRKAVFSPRDEVYYMDDGFPLLSMRPISFDAVVDELLWFVSGSTYSSDMKYKFFWDKWTAKKPDAIKYGKEVLGLCGTDEEIFEALPFEVKARIGTIGNLYGVSWRNAPAPRGTNLPFRHHRDYPRVLAEKMIPVDMDGNPVFNYDELMKFLDENQTGTLQEMKLSLLDSLKAEYWSRYDQLNELVIKLKKNPTSSRLRVTAYVTDYMAFEEFSPQDNTMDGRAALTPCHTFFQCFVDQVPGRRSRLSLKLTLTSSDVPVGRPYNIAQYALLLMMLAQVCDMDADRLIISSGDTHIYTNQTEAVDELLKRPCGVNPTVRLNKDVKDLFAFKREDFTIENYNPQEKIDIPVAV